MTVGHLSTLNLHSKYPTIVFSHESVPVGLNMRFIASFTHFQHNVIIKLYFDIYLWTTNHNLCFKLYVSAF